jgi:hypothetical protein
MTKDEITTAVERAKAGLASPDEMAKLLTEFNQAVTELNALAGSIIQSLKGQILGR